MTELQVLPKDNSVEYGFTQENIRLIKDQIAKEATDDELRLFLIQCQRTNLDPFARQIYLIPRWDSKLGRKVYMTQISIDGARLIAQRTGEYAGQTPVFWCGEDEIWKDVWLSNSKPMAAKVGVYRKGFVEPLYAVANWSAYAQKDKGGRLTHMWETYSALMLGKVAESLALRRAFPMEMSGLYTEAEISSEESERENKDNLDSKNVDPSTPKVTPDGSKNSATVVDTTAKAVIGEHVSAAVAEESQRELSTKQVNLWKIRTRGIAQVDLEMIYRRFGKDGTSWKTMSNSEFNCALALAALAQRIGSRHDLDYYNWEHEKKWYDLSEEEAKAEALVKR